MADDAAEAQLRRETKHPAWTFNPDTFHKWLGERIVEDDKLRLDTLQELARAAVAEASPITKYILESMRFDEE